QPSNPVGRVSGRPNWPSLGAALASPPGGEKATLAGSPGLRRGVAPRSVAGQPLQRLDDLQPALHRLLALLALTLDHLLGGAGDEVRLRQLGVDAGDVPVDLAEFLPEALALGVEVDDADERQAGDRRADDDLRRLRRRRLGEGDR